MLLTIVSYAGMVILVFGIVVTTYAIVVGKRLYRLIGVAIIIAGTVMAAVARDSMKKDKRGTTIEKNN